MYIEKTKQELTELVMQSEKVKRSFAALVLVNPQIIHEDDHEALRTSLDIIASNFETAASFIYEFSRMGPASRKFTVSKSK